MGAAPKLSLLQNTVSLELVFKTVGDVMFYIAHEPEDQFRFVLVNDAFLQSTGLPKEAVIGKSVRDVIPEPAFSSVLQHYRTAIRTKEAIFWEEQSVYPAGTKYGEVTVRAVYEKDGRCTGLVGTVHDITERKLNEQSMKRVLSLQRATIESTADGILVVDIDGKIVDYNQRLLEVWNIPAAVVDNVSYQESLAQVLPLLEDPEECVRRLQIILSEQSKESHDIIPFKDGTVLERYTRPQHLDGKYFGRVFSYRDITERVRIEKESQTRASRNQFLADLSQAFAKAKLNFEPIVEVAAQLIADHFQEACIVRLFSSQVPGFRTISFHHSNPEISRAWWAFAPNDLQMVRDEVLNKVLETGLPVRATVDSSVTTKNKSERIRDFYERYPFRYWMGVPIRIAGRVLGILVICRAKNQSFSQDEEEFAINIADRTGLAIENADLFTKAQESIRLRDDFLLTASHELKTPLTPLKIHLQLLARAARSENFGPDSTKLISIASRNVTKLERLVRGMFEAARMGVEGIRLNLRRLDLYKLIKIIVATHQPELNIARCKLELSLEQNVTGNWDRMRIEQVITNLLGNAIKFGSGKPIHISLKRMNGTARITVQDQGSGIKPEDQSQVFNPFMRGVSATQYGGLGLGLFLARQIVYAHGGQIHFESASGKGTTFIVDLPIGYMVKGQNPS